MMGLFSRFNWFGFGQSRESAGLCDNSPVFIGVVENPVYPDIMEIMFYQADAEGQRTVELASIVDSEVKEQIGGLAMGQKFHYTYINSGLPADILICEITAIDKVSPLLEVPKDPFELVA